MGQEEDRSRPHVTGLHLYDQRVYYSTMDTIGLLEALLV